MAARRITWSTMNYYNLSLPDLTRRLTKHGLLDERANVNGSIAVRRRSGDNKEILLYAHYVVNGAQPFVQAKHEYDDLHLAKESLSVAELLDRFSRAAEGRPFELCDGLTTAVTFPASVKLLPSTGPTAVEGARYLVEVRAKDTEGLPTTGPMLRYGQLSFESLQQAVRFWIPLRPMSRISEGRNGHVIFDVPLIAPRLGELTTPRERMMRVAIDDIPLGTVPELSGVWQSDDAEQIEPFAYQVKGPFVEVVRPEWADQVSLWLTLSDSLVTDWFFENATRCSRTLRTLFPADGHSGGTQAEVQAQIHGGENETVEFKPVVSFEPGKFDEVIETVIAFANKHGGTIYLGVGNHQEILGVEKRLRELFPAEVRKSTHERAQMYCTMMRTKINDRVVGTCNFTIEPILVAGMTVIRVVVAEGKQKPYSDFQTGEMWTRRGANTVKPDANEVKAMVAGEPRGNTLFDL